MSSFQPRHSTLLLIGFALAALMAGACGSSSPAAPSSGNGSGVGVSSVVLATSTIGVGGTTQGTVTLAAPGSGATSVTLTSSNTAVATVASPVTVAAGSATATFTVTGTGAGTASISASAGGTAGQSPTLTVARVALSAITLSGATVVGGVSVTGTAVLSAPAPAGGAAVALSANNDAVSVPATVTVPAGATTALFTVTTRLVGGTIGSTVTGSYGGASASASVSVTKPSVANANFGITGPTETETCSMSNGGATLDCTFNGSTSTAPGNIVAYDWSFRVGTMAAITQTTTGPVLGQPTVNCSWLPPPPLPPGSQQWLPLIVTLKVRDDQGNVSADAVDNGARVFPQGVCGY